VKLHFSNKKHSDGEEIARALPLFSPSVRSSDILLSRLHPCTLATSSVRPLSPLFSSLPPLPPSPPLSLSLSLFIHLSIHLSFPPVSFPRSLPGPLLFGVGIYSAEKPQAFGESCSAGWKLATEPMNRFFQRCPEGHSLPILRPPPSPRLSRLHALWRGSTWRRYPS